jgi:hypothetical protein
VLSPRFSEGCYEDPNGLRSMALPSRFPTATRPASGRTKALLGRALLCDLAGGPIQGLAQGSGATGGGHRHHEQPILHRDLSSRKRISGVAGPQAYGHDAPSYSMAADGEQRQDVTDNLP